MPAPAVIHWVSPLVMTPAAAGGVLVLEGAVDHVGDRLEAPVRVPGGALGLAGRVLHLAHLVHVDEGIQTSRGTPAKARRTGNPSPSKPDGAVVMHSHRAGPGRGLRSMDRPVRAGSGAATTMLSTVTAGMCQPPRFTGTTPSCGRNYSGLGASSDGGLRWP